jgi:hypothetical protein
METPPLKTDGRGIRHGPCATSATAVKTRNQGVRRILNHMLSIAPWLADTDRAALRHGANWNGLRGALCPF